MGIFDNIVSAAGQHAGLNPEQHSGLVDAVTQMFGNHQAITNLQNNANNQGLGSIVQSWIGTGQNQPVAPDQVQGMVGQDMITQLANRVGIPPAIASAALSHILPMVVDRLTPNGHIPNAA